MATPSLGPATGRSRRPCRTPEDCFRAGWEDGARLGERLTARQRERLAILLRPYLAEPARKTA